MKNFTKLFRNIKEAVTKPLDPYQNTDATSTFFKKVQATDAKNNTSSNPEVLVEDKIPGLDRIIVRGTEKSRVILKVEEIVFRAHYHRVPQELKDACEIVHYHVLNDLPVRLSLVKMVLPDIDVESNNLVDEAQYEEWLKHKHRKGGEDLEIEIEDTYSMNEGPRGKKAPENWNINPGADFKSWSQHSQKGRK